MRKKLDSSDNSSDEIDLEQLFRLVGNLFNNFVKFIEKILVMNFNLLIEILFFFKKNLLKIILTTLIFACLGYVLDKREKPTYYSKMLVEPNYGTIFQLYNNIEYYNELASNNDSMELAKIFNIKIEEASKIYSFEISPGPENEKEKLKAYDEFIKTSDSITVSVITFDEFIESQVNEYSSSRHEIIVKSRQRDIFPKLEEAIIKGINFNSYVKKIHKEEISSLIQKEKDIKEALVRVDSLNTIYNQVLITESAKQNTASTSIDLGGVNGTQTKELEVLSLKNNYNESLRDVRKEITSKENFVNVISSFQAVGPKQADVLKKKVVILAILGFMLITSFLLIRKLDKFITTYHFKLMFKDKMA